MARRGADGTMDRLVQASREAVDGAFTSFSGSRLTLGRARAGKWDCPALGPPGQIVSIDTASSCVSVAAGDGIVILEEVQLEGCERCEPAAVFKSLRDRLGRGSKIDGMPDSGQPDGRIDK